MTMLQQPLLTLALPSRIIRIARMPKNSLNYSFIIKISSMLHQPICLFKTTSSGIFKNDRSPLAFSIHICPTLHQELYVPPLVLRQECLKKKGFIVGVPSVRITAMVQQQFQVDRIFLLHRPHHGVLALEVATNATVLEMLHDLVGFSRIRISSILQHRPQPIRVMRHDWPHQQRIAVCGEDHVRVDVFLLHQPPNFLDIAMLGRQRQRLRLGVGEERGQVVCGLLPRRRYRQRIAASAGQQQE
ncbi:hypothetical protein A6R73_07290 [Xanthomonas translucens pv. poae]|uniref:Uncharacterized protein n=1 Tax=Xanthomonas graminis pv. poae TaxID=227946 RepID=A0A199NXN1_9XANT|nr:hypothetical protein A6R73_07290 [Xanthomonas translucens pv. poae]